MCRSMPPSRLLSKTTGVQKTIGFYDLVVRFLDFWCVFRSPPSPPAADGPTMDFYDLVVRFLISGAFPRALRGRADSKKLLKSNGFQ